jgi:TAT-translocated FGD2 family F420-dependent dehydrogenase
LAHEQFPVPELVRLGILAEQAGFDHVSTSDHFQPWQANEGHSGSAWVTLGALAVQTRRLWMGTMVTCPTIRYQPAIVAEAFASLSLLAPGRIYLGVGSGEALNEQAATGEWPAWSERWDRLIEACTLIRELWTGAPVDSHGRYYRVKARLYDTPPAPIPLLTAANGPRAMSLAGQHGDGLITDPKTWKEHGAKWRAGARSAHKDPDRMPVMVELFVNVGTEKDAHDPAELWRFLPKAFKGYHNIPDPVTIQRAAEDEVKLDEVLSQWTVSRNPAVHIKAIEELWASGITLVNIHSAAADQRSVIDFYAREVLPKLRRTAPSAARASS